MWSDTLLDVLRFKYIILFCIDDQSNDILCPCWSEIWATFYTEGFVWYKRFWSSNGELCIWLTAISKVLVTPRDLLLLVHVIKNFLWSFIFSKVFWCQASWMLHIFFFMNGNFVNQKFYLAKRLYWKANATTEKQKAQTKQGTGQQNRKKQRMKLCNQQPRMNEKTVSV